MENEETETQIPEGKNYMAIMGREGDTKISWSPDSAVEVDEARRSFENMKRKGYMAFRTNRDGTKGEQIREFDPHAAAIILAPQMQGG